MMRLLDTEVFRERLVIPLPNTLMSSKLFLKRDLKLVQEEMWVRFLGQEDPLEEGVATLSSILAWRIPWTEGLAGYSP